METLCAAVGCAAAVMAVLLGAPLFGGRSARPRRKPHPGSRRDWLIARMEVLGHWIPVIRLGNYGPIPALSERLRAALRGRGLAMTRRACVALCLVWVAAGTLAGAIVSLSPLGAAVGLGGSLGACAFFVGSWEKRLKNEAAAQMPEVLRSLSAALGAGKSLPQAIEHAGRRVGEPMGSEFLKASFEIKSGRTVDEAVASLCERVHAPGMALLGTALQISQRTGSSLNDLFARTGRMVSNSVSLRHELEVKTSQVRLSARVVAIMPVLLAGVLVLLSSDYRFGLSTAVGRGCLCVAAALDLSALWCIQRLMKGGAP